MHNNITHHVSIGQSLCVFLGTREQDPAFSVYYSYDFQDFPKHKSFEIITKHMYLFGTDFALIY